MLKRIAANLISNYLLTLVSMVLGFILVPFLIAKLGQEAYGLIVLAESTILLFEIITISIRIALSRHAAFCLAQGKKEDFVDYLSTGLGIALVAAAAVFVFALSLSAGFSTIFRVPPQYHADSRWLFLMISLAFSVTILNSIYWSVLYAHHRLDLINIASSGGLIVRALSLLIFFSFLPRRYVTLPAYGLIHLAMIVVDNYLVYHWHKKVMPGLRMSLKRFRKDKLREILSFSAYSSLSRVNAVLYDSTANFLVNRFWGVSANAVFAIAMKFPSLMERLFINTAWMLTPTFTDLVARDEREKFSALYSVYTKFITIITAPLCLLLVVIAAPLVRWWVGPGFETAGRMLPILMIPLLVTIPYSVSGCITNAYAKVKLPSQLGFVAAVLNVTLGITLGRGLSMGLYGIAVASAATSFVYATFIAHYACRVGSLPFFRYFKSAYLKPMAWSGVIFGAFYALTRMFGHDLSLNLLMALELAILLVFNYLGAYFIVLSAGERKQVKDTLKAIFSKLGAGNAELQT